MMKENVFRTVSRIALLSYLVFAAVQLKADQEVYDPEVGEGGFLISGQVATLRCEYLVNPQGIDVLAPRLSWMLSPGGNGAERGMRQTAYRVLVASSLEQLAENRGDLWDSGKVESDESNHVDYAGKELLSRMQCYWKVMVWDKDNRASAWSETSSWGTGMLSPDPASQGSAGTSWQGQWIQSDLELFEYQKELKKLPDHNMETEGAMRARAKSVRHMTAGVTEAPAVWMRKEFAAENQLRKATLIISGLGLYEAYLNGHKINDHLLTVTPHDFGKSVPVHAHDVTGLVKQGKNGLGVLLGNGYYNPVIPSLLREYAADFIDTPRLRCELLLQYENGTTCVVPSDLSWKFTTAGPIRFNSIRAGEIYDARRELGAWSSAGYAAEGWSPVRPATAPSGRMRLRTLPPVRVLKTIPAVSVSKHGAGYRFDIGVESTGWARLKLRGKAGQRITIRYPGAGSHTLGRYQTFEYICKGEGEEVYEPRFAFNGYRHVDVHGLDYSPELTDLVGCLVASDLPRTGSFSCSDERINTLQEVNLRTLRNYVVGTPMDPVREKVNWTQDVQTNFETSFYNFDVCSIYEKWQDDFVDGILENGYVPTVVPSCFDGPTINGPWWGGMIVFNPWQLYRSYGDERILAESYEAMKRHMGYYDSIASDNIITWGLGDWMDVASGGRGRPKGTTQPYTSTCAYKMYADILAKTAAILGKQADAEHFAEKSESIRQAIHRRFYQPETGVYDLGSQTAYILALKLEIVAEEDRGQVLDQLATRIAQDTHHLSTGFVGTPFLLTFLNEEGRGDLAWKIATQETHPGWYNMIFNEKNSVFKENWQGGLVQMPSLAGPIGAWFYRSLGGIRPDAPGFRSIIIEPYTETLDWVKCSYESPYGEIRSDWKKMGSSLTMDVTIPANTTATVYVPANDVASVTESGKPAVQSEGVRFLRMEEGRAVFEVTSGTYAFAAAFDR